MSVPEETAAGLAQAEHRAAAAVLETPGHLGPQALEPGDVRSFLGKRPMSLIETVAYSRIPDDHHRSLPGEMGPNVATSRPAKRPEAVAGWSSGDTQEPRWPEFILPFHGGRITSLFNQGRYHPAIDLAGRLGTPVHATTRGQRVTFTGRRGGYGNLVITRDPQGRQHYYGHLQRITARPGTVLRQGQMLGTLGSTGRSTGPHVHYEVRTAAGRHMDPRPLLFPGRGVGRGYAWRNAAPVAMADRAMVAGYPKQ